MAYIFNNEDEELNNQRNQPGQAQQSGILSAGQSGTGAPGASAGTTDGKKTGSGFVNLQKYLGVNKDNANQMANQVVGEGSKEEGDLSSAQTGYSQLNPGHGVSMWGYDDGDRLNVIEGELNKSQYSDDVSEATKDWLGGNNEKSYSGSSIQDVDTRYGAVSSAKDKVLDKAKLTADSLDGQSARANFLKSKFNKDGRYSAGENSFDSFLTGASDKANDETSGFAARNKALADKVAAADKQIANASQLKGSITANRGEVDAYNNKFANLKAILAGKQSKPVEPVAPVSPVAEAAPEQYFSPENTSGMDVVHGINKGIRDGSYTTNQELQRVPDNIGAAGTNVANVLSGKKKLF